MALPRLLDDDIAKIQVLFRCIHSPAQQGEQKGGQTGKGRESGKEVPHQTSQRGLRRRRTSQPPQTWGTRQLALFVGYAFAAERSAAVWTPCGRFAQRMKQAPGMAQADPRRLLARGG